MADAEAAAEVDERAASSRARRGSARRTPRAATIVAAVRVEVGELRADVHVEPGDVEPALERSLDSPQRLSSGGRPNFEPWWPVRIASCVSASTPGVTRTSTRRTPAAAARLASSGASSTTVAPASAAAARSSSSDLLLPCTTSWSPVEPGRARERELAERRDVGAEPFLGEQPQHRDVRERLRPVDDERARSRGAEGAGALAQRLLAVDDERRAEARGELGRRDPAERELAVAIAAELGEELEHARRARRAVRPRDGQLDAVRVRTVTEPARGDASSGGWRPVPRPLPSAAVQELLA